MFLQDAKATPDWASEGLACRRHDGDPSLARLCRIVLKCARRYKNVTVMGASSESSAFSVSRLWYAAVADMVLLSRTCVLLSSHAPYATAMSIFKRFVVSVGGASLLRCKHEDGEALVQRGFLAHSSETSGVPVLCTDVACLSRFSARDARSLVC